MSDLMRRPGCLGMLVRIALRLLVLAVIIFLVEKIVPGIHVYGGFGWYVWVAFIFSVVNLVLGTLFRLLSLPLIVLTLGLFLLIVNAAVLGITAALTSHPAVANFGSAVLGGFLIALFSWVAELLLPPRNRGPKEP